MTGSANIPVNSEKINANIDVTSVNNRYLEMYIKIPDTLRHLESKLRSMCQERLSRGKIDIYISYSLNASENLNIDKTALASISEAIREIGNSVANVSVSAVDILNYPGILKQDDTIQDLVDKTILENFSKALDKLVQSREQEGEKLKNALLKLLDAVEAQTEVIGPQLDKLVALEREKIKAKIAAMKIEVNPERIEQEVALSAQKADVREEYDRLLSHIKEVRAILGKGGVCGKRLDFMMQEFNREANTLASKASSLEITKTAVELKVIIEQMREQVQNLQ